MNTFKITVYVSFCVLVCAAEKSQTHSFKNKQTLGDKHIQTDLSEEAYIRRRDVFIAEYGDLYNQQAEEIARRELGRLEGHTYLDYTGSGLYQTSQLSDIFEDFSTNAYGNAHSRNPSANLTDNELKKARQLILEFFNASPQDDYSVIFTSGATGGLKLVGEDFPWSDKSIFAHLRINHNSVLGIREYAAHHNATIEPISRIEITKTLKERRAQNTHNDFNSPNHCLLAYPAKDNAVGHIYPLEWITDVETYGLTDDCNWHVLVDAAAFVPTKQFNLTQYNPDYFVISFYKMFGYPTGLGALLIKSAEASIFNKIYFGGGSVVSTACDSRWCKIKDNPSLRFEDGTVSFLDIVSLKYGLRILEAVGMPTIEKHVMALTHYTVMELTSMYHMNGAPVATIYSETPLTPIGGVIGFNLYRPDGSVINFAEIEYETSEDKIHLRTGCFCNPGACQDYLFLSEEDLRHSSVQRESCSDPFNPFRNRPLGFIRVSLGYMTTFKDVDKLLLLIRHKYMQ